MIETSKNSSEFDHLSAGEETLAYLPMAWVGDFIFSIFPDSFRATGSGGLRAGNEQGLHLWPDLSGGELQYQSPPRGVLDGGA